MKKLPVGIQTFSELIEDNYVYVDKTQYIYDLISSGKYYFLSRPRRFGKSLLVSTLGAIFSGKKELFEGLAISSLPYEWKRYSVLTISFAGIPHKDPNNLIDGIKLYLQEIASEHNIVIDPTFGVGEALRYLVKKMFTEAPVVLLIDEYDYSILRHIHEPDSANAIREVLRDFYSVIKDLDPYLKFVFLTGISKFSKTSIFSGLNNLEDISALPDYNALVGYTKDELTTFFLGHLSSVALKMNQTVPHILDEIKIWYDGYRFSKQDTKKGIYNPFSVLLFLKSSDFSNYWFETGTPTFLINLLKSKNYPLQELDNIQATMGELSQFDVEDIDLKALLFQTGYITIKSYDPDSHNYTLGYVNKETALSLGQYIIKSMIGVSRAGTMGLVAAMIKLFNQSNLDGLFTLLTEFFATIPYTIQIEQEKYYQTVFFLIFKMIGADIIVEQPTNNGRIDAVLQTKDSCFIIEFKINDTAKKAIEQIKAKKYYQAYQSLGKKIILVGIAFDTKKRNVSAVEYFVRQ